MTRPGEVQTDIQAFHQILDRLTNEVGTLINLAGTAQSQGAFGSSAPFWAIVRMMMPIAESLGDLIYQDESTSANLVNVLENRFEAVRSGYRGKSSVIAILYRHGLAHQDELRCLTTKGRVVVWSLSFGEPAKHLHVERIEQNQWMIHMDLHAFYEDLVKVCEACLTENWKGNVKDRYNSWLDYNLDINKRGKVNKVAVAEIAAFQTD